MIKIATKLRNCDRNSTAILQTFVLIRLLFDKRMFVIAGKELKRTQEAMRQKSALALTTHMNGYEVFVKLTCVLCFL